MNLIATPEEEARAATLAPLITAEMAAQRYLRLCMEWLGNIQWENDAERERAIELVRMPLDRGYFKINRGDPDVNGFVLAAAKNAQLPIIWVGGEAVLVFDADDSLLKRIKLRFGRKAKIEKRDGYARVACRAGAELTTAMELVDIVRGAS